MSIKPEIIKLNNGITLIFDKTESFFSTAVRININFGSHHEDEDVFGIAHFIEHMMFKGTKNRTAAQIIEQLDMLSADINAYTGKESTAYTLNIVNKYLFEGLDILCDMLSNSNFLADEIEKERSVIIQEIYECKDDPEEFLNDTFLDNCYKNQPLGHNILGSVKTVSNITRENLLNYVKKYYVANNTVIAVSGNIDAQKLIDFFNKNLAFETGYAASIPKSQLLFNNTFIKRDLEQCHFLLAYDSVNYFDKNYYKANMMSMILGSGMSSRLFMEVRENLGLCYSIGAYLSSYYTTGMLVVSSSTSPDKFDKSLSAIGGVIESMVNIKPLELQKIKNHFSVFFMTSLDSVSTRANFCLNQFLRYNNIPSFEQITDEIESFTTLDIQNYAADTFSNKNCVIGVIANKEQTGNYDKLSHLKLC